MGFIQALLHIPDFTNADILVGIPDTITNVDIGGGDFAEAGIAITGMGQAGLFGMFGSDCDCSSVPPTPPGPSPVDPPAVYVFSDVRDYLNLNLTMVRADDFSFDIAVVLNGVPINLTGGTLRMTAKWKVTDPDADEVFSVSTPSNGIFFIDATVGTATVTIASALTNVTAIPFHKIDLPYDLRFTDSGGVISTVMRGLLTILPNSSRTSP